MIIQEEVTTAEIDAAVTLSSLCISLITAEIKRNKHIVLSRPAYRALETLRADLSQYVIFHSETHDLVILTPSFY